MFHKNRDKDKNKNLDIIMFMEMECPHCLKQYEVIININNYPRMECSNCCILDRKGIELNVLRGYRIK